MIKLILAASLAIEKAAEARDGDTISNAIQQISAYLAEVAIEYV